MARWEASTTCGPAAQVGAEIKKAAAPMAKARGRHSERGCIIVPSFPKRRAVLGPAPVANRRGSTSLAEGACCAQKACDMIAEKPARLVDDGQSPDQS